MNELLCGLGCGMVVVAGYGDGGCCAECLAAEADADWRDAQDSARYDADHEWQDVGGEG